MIYFWVMLPSLGDAKNCLSERNGGWDMTGCGWQHSQSSFSTRKCPFRFAGLFQTWIYRTSDSEYPCSKICQSSVWCSRVSSPSWHFLSVSILSREPISPSIFTEIVDRDGMNILFSKYCRLVLLVHAPPSVRATTTAKRSRRKVGGSSHSYEIDICSVLLHVAQVGLDIYKFAVIFRWELTQRVPFPHFSILYCSQLCTEAFSVMFKPCLKEKRFRTQYIRLVIAYSFWYSVFRLEIVSKTIYL